MSAQLGTRRPLHCTALGKAYLAALPGQELEARLTGLEMTRFMTSTITDPAALEAELDRVRERGATPSTPRRSRRGCTAWERPSATTGSSRRLGHG
jgi:DNA-binding IclR family transcriptional regulator